MKWCSFHSPQIYQIRTLCWSSLPKFPFSGTWEKSRESINKCMRWDGIKRGCNWPKTVPKGPRHSGAPPNLLGWDGPRGVAYAYMLRLWVYGNLIFSLWFHWRTKCLTEILFVRLFQLRHDFALQKCSHCLIYCPLSRLSSSSFRAICEWYQNLLLSAFALDPPSRSTKS